MPFYLSSGEIDLDSLQPQQKNRRESIGEKK